MRLYHEALYDWDHTVDSLWESDRGQFPAPQASQLASDEKTEVAIIGAGGFVFPLRLVGDILSFGELQSAELALMDVNPETLARTAIFFAPPSVFFVASGLETAMVRAGGALAAAGSWIPSLA